jgi:heptaprenyl diphosphate synthase
MTPSASETSADRLIAGFAALAVVIQVLETSFPSPIPGIKPGLANAVTLIVLLRHGWHSAAWVSALRVLAGSLLTGSFLAPAFWLSASGALCSLLILGLCVQWNRLPLAPLSVLGLSVVSALAHTSGQFFVAYHWFVPHPGVLHLLPVLMGAALLFGLVTGWATEQILRRLKPVVPKPILPP